MSELRTLISKRATIKSNLTKVANKIDGESSTSKLKTYQKIVDPMLTNFDEVQSLILELDSNNVDTNFFDKYVETLSKITDALEGSIQNVGRQHSTSSSGHVIESKIKLPTLNLPEFNGNCQKWLSFQESFETMIHNNETLNNIQRFHYLKSCLKDEPLNLINSLPITDENYTIATKLLIDRYENKRLIVKTNINALFHLNTVTKDAPNSLRNLMDKVTLHLKVLKSLSLPTEKWDSLIIHLICSKLDYISNREWENSITNDIPTLEELFTFLTKRCQLLEALNFNKVPLKNNQFTSFSKHKENNNLRSASHITTNKIVCALCKQAHHLQNCDKFLELDHKNRHNEIKRLKLCILCLRGNHSFSRCREIVCGECQGRHHTLLHIPAAAQTMPSGSAPEAVQEFIAIPSTSSSNHCANVSTHIMLSTALIDVLDINNKPHSCRALLDMGSQPNFITESTCKKLGLYLEPINSPITGVNQIVSSVHHKTIVKLKSKTDAYETSLVCSVLPKITQNLPAINFDKSFFNIPNNIQLADPDFNVSAPIDLLIGAEVFWDLMSTGKLKLPKNRTTLQKTKFGWIIGGPVTIDRVNIVPMQSMSVTLHVSLDQQLTKFWQLETIPEHNVNSSEHSACERHFINNYSRNSSGRFVVRLPFKKNFESLGHSKEIAIKRFYLLEKTFYKQPELKSEYIKFIEEYIALGHMTLNSNPELNKLSNHAYLPHHAIVKPSSSSTKLRVVFDASSKTSTGVSLNDTLLVGPPFIQPDLFTILIRFRTYKYVITADIKKMYRQILVHPEDRNYQQIVWRANPNEDIETYHLNTVAYGTSSAPFLAVRSLQQLAYEEAGNFPMAKSAILNDFYVDDLITGTNSFTDALLIRDQLIDVLKKGGFELSKWATNESAILPSCQRFKLTNNKTLINLDKEGNTKTLGLSWNCINDVLKYDVSQLNAPNKITKRVILSITAKLFDPLGLINPVVVLAKLSLQNLWSSKIGWDDAIPKKLHETWRQLFENLPVLADLKIPRIVVEASNTIELHGFSDASESAYGACLYVRTMTAKNKYTVQLLCAKSRVAPLKKISLPRLELCAAVLLSHLFHKIQSIINLDITRSYMWTDSKIVLAWLAEEPHVWKTFIANRVAEINLTTRPTDWNYIPTELNPADIISRGMAPNDLTTSCLWWHGPNFLSDTNFQWPTNNYEQNLDLSIERRTQVTCVTTQGPNNEFLEMFERFSNFSKLQRVIGYCKRFINNLKPTNIKQNGGLTAFELNRAERFILNQIQLCKFPSEIGALRKNKLVHNNSALKSLNPFIDEHGLIRLGGRLRNTKFPDDIKHPILLPKHHVTNLLIFREHIKLLHAGQQATLSSLRQRYWPISARSSVRQILHKCLICFKTNPQTISQIMGDLPSSRVEPSRPFINCGIDYAGPILLKDGFGRGRKLVKAYIALFICLATKAIHIEIVTDLTTQAFLAALKRFTARRGNVKIFYSDNATCFVGANRELKNLKHLFKSQNFQSQIIDVLATDNITWHFIPPKAPHHGGLWEAAIKSVKRHLKRVIGETSLTYEEMYTVLTCIEACLNSRPLTSISNDPNDLTPLTPSHFLIGDLLTSTVEPDMTKLNVHRLSRWQRMEQIRQHFWRRWSSEYLTQLQQRSKWHQPGTNIAVNTMVLIKEDNLPTLRWPLGRIIGVHPGKDGHIRVVSIRTAKGTVTRAVTKVCPLPH